MGPAPRSFKVSRVSRLYYTGALLKLVHLLTRALKVLPKITQPGKKMLHGLALFPCILMAFFQSIFPTLLLSYFTDKCPNLEKFIYNKTTKTST